VHAEVKAGRDPLDTRDDAARPAGAGATFRTLAELHIATHAPGWKAERDGISRSEKQWRSSLTSHAYPVIGDKLARDVTRADVLAILQPIWTALPETATRLRERIEAVLNGARFREGWPAPYENPAVWRGGLAHVLPSNRRRDPKHHAALPYADAPDFAHRLRTHQRGVAALALEFVLLTAARSGQVIGMRWEHVDMEAATWRVPGALMKSGTAMRVPLAPAAMRVLDEMWGMRRISGGGEYVFPGQRHGKPLSGAAMLSVLTRMELDVTVHGLRSTFRDWVAEETLHDADVAEAVLDHELSGGKTRAAYQRGDLWTKRRILMEAWANYLSGDGPSPESVN
jgi:integrase